MKLTTFLFKKAYEIKCEEVVSIMSLTSEIMASKTYQYLIVRNILSILNNSYDLELNPGAIFKLFRILKSDFVAQGSGS
jgi:hypothetical protein